MHVTLTGSIVLKANHEVISFYVTKDVNLPNKTIPYSS